MAGTALSADDEIHDGNQKNGKLFILHMPGKKNTNHYGELFILCVLP